MECGSKGKRFGAINENLTGFLVIKLKRRVCKRNHFGKKRKILGDYDRPETMPENSTWYVMTEIPGLNYKDVGNLYGCNWVEYGLNQSKMNWDGQISAD